MTLAAIRCGAAGQASRADFNGLASLCRALDIRIAVTESPYVGPRELLMLGAIAIHQRGDAGQIEFVSAALGGQLALCASALLEQDCKLPARTLGFSKLAERGWATSGLPKRIATRTHAASERSDRTLRWKMTEFARARDRVSSAELQTLGASRQYISVLCKTGVFERVAHGYYRLPSA